MVQEYVFASDALEFSPRLLNRLAPDRWRHWGRIPLVSELDYPIYDRILLLQSIVLSDLLSSDRLARIRDEEFKAGSGEALTLPELFGELQTGIWTEVLQTNSDAITISSLRRGLQRQHLNILTNMVLRDVSVLDNAQNFFDIITAINTQDTPEDARVLARYQLRQLQDAIARSLDQQGSRLDITTKAHLEDTHHRIHQILDAQYLSR